MEIRFWWASKKRCKGVLVVRAGWKGVFDYRRYSDHSAEIAGDTAACCSLSHHLLPLWSFSAVLWFHWYCYFIILTDTELSKNPDQRIYVCLMWLYKLLKLNLIVARNRDRLYFKIYLKIPIVWNQHYQPIDLCSKFRLYRRGPRFWKY